MDIKEILREVRNKGVLRKYFPIDDYAAQIQVLIDEEKEKFGLEVAESERALCRAEIFKEIEKEFGYFSDRGLDKIIIDDGGYYGNPGSLKKWQALKKGGE